MKLLLFLLLLTLAYPATYPIEADCYYTVLATGSMEPVFNEHFDLYIRKLPFRDIRVGDVVLYLAPGQTVPTCHRVVRKSSGGSVVIEKGDHNMVEDPYLIDESMYVGVVVAIVRVN